MNIPIAITGLGLITPLDTAQNSTWQAMGAGVRVGEKRTVRDELLDAEVRLDRSIRLALAAARQAHRGEKCALFCGTSKGPVGTYLAASDRLRRGEALSQMEALHVALGTGAMGTILRERLGFSDEEGGGMPVHTSVAACASGMFALHRAAQAIERGECRRALVVAADASLHPLFEGSFERLGVIAPMGENGVRRCEPFGDQGNGFFLIEAAAAVMLEAANHGDLLLDHSWIGADSTGLIGIDADTRTLRAGLAIARARGRPAFVHAHATGTAHDAYELAAIRAAFGPDTPVFSHKKYLGHSLGAAGLVSVVISAMCHREGRTLTGDKLAENARSITIAQGFGGHVGVIVLQGRKQPLI